MLLIPALLLSAGASTGTSAPRSTAGEIRLVVLGDSVPYGSACGCTPFGAQYAAMLGRRTHRTVASTNLSLPGGTSADLRSQLGTRAASTALRSATTVLIMVGANDFQGPFARSRAGLCAAGGCYGATAQQLKLRISDSIQQVRHAHGGDLSIVVLDYWDVVEDGEVGDRDYGPEGAADSQRATSYADGALVSAARARGTGFVSTRQVFRGAGNGGDPTSLLAADGDHPNDRGHRAIALALDRYLPNG